MSLQKYRADKSRKQPDGAIVWSAHWMGGPTLSKIQNCRLIDLHGDMRSTVYITGEADTYFSIPAKTRLFGKTLNGYVTSKDGELVFQHCYY